MKTVIVKGARHRSGDMGTERYERVGAEICLELGRSGVWIIGVGGSVVEIDGHLRIRIPTIFALSFVHTF